jgi:tetratricopeptide (TPR) repeat protein
MKFSVYIVLLIGFLLLQACAGSPPENQNAPNLYSSDPLCVAPVEEPVEDDSDDESQVVLEELVEANKYYSEKRYEEAMQAYENVLVVSDAPKSNIESLIGLAKLRLMAESGLADVELADMVMKELDRRLGKAGLQDVYYAEMALLNSILDYEKTIKTLRTDKSYLERELARKEEAIRRLKELTVGPAE